MSTIEQLLKALSPTVEEKINQPTFYAHINILQQKIVGISGICVNDSEVNSLVLEEKIALDFLSGVENPNNWVVGFKDDKYEIAKLTKEQEFNYFRNDVLPIKEMKPQTEAEYNLSLKEPDDVLIILDSATGLMKITYNGDSLMKFPDLMKFYVTREGDPSALKCVLQLNEDTLNTVMQQKKLKRWPNPLSVSIPGGIDDISIFTKKSHLKNSLVRA